MTTATQSRAAEWWHGLFRPSRSLRDRLRNVSVAFRLLLISLGLAAIGLLAWLSVWPGLLRRTHNYGLRGTGHELTQLWLPVILIQVVPVPLIQVLPLALLFRWPVQAWCVSACGMAVLVYTLPRYSLYRDAFWPWPVASVAVFVLLSALLATLATD